MRVLSRTNLAYRSYNSSLNPRPFNLLQPLCSLFAAPVLCFQQLAASFPKTPGVGLCAHASPLESTTCRLISASARRPRRLFTQSLEGRVILGQRICLAKGRSNTETTAALTTFRINTCKSVSKQRTLTPFRINTYKKTGEGGTLRPSDFSAFVANPARRGCVQFPYPRISVKVPERVALELRLGAL